MLSIDRRRFLQGSAGLVLAPYLAACTEYAKHIPRSSFGAAATAEEVTTGIDLTGKTALVTGCNSGIGYETMRVLALRGAHVFGTARSEQKGRTACNSVKGHCTPLVLELTDFDSIVECANQVQGQTDVLDILVCNAGVLFNERRQLNGLELHFVVNHLGHFLLVNRLLDQVISAPQGRVVVVSSDSHRRAPSEGIQFDDLTGQSWTDSAYAHSKLANGLFSLELARRLQGTNATSNALHPGRVKTRIFRNVERPSPARQLKNPEQGGATPCYLATNPVLIDVSGYYFVDCNPKEPSPLMRDGDMAQELWDVSEELMQGYLA